VKIQNKYINFLLTQMLDKAKNLLDVVNDDIHRDELGIKNLQKRLDNNNIQKRDIERRIKTLKFYIGEEIRVKEGESLPEEFIDYSFMEEVL